MSMLARWKELDHHTLAAEAWRSDNIVCILHLLNCSVHGDGQPQLPAFVITGISTLPDAVHAIRSFASHSMQ